jgi:hypothetical protein
VEQCQAGAEVLAQHLALDIEALGVGVGLERAAHERDVLGDLVRRARAGALRGACSR